MVPNSKRHYWIQPLSHLPDFTSLNSVLSGTSDSPGVRHFSSLASFHTHIRASSRSLIVLRPVSHSRSPKRRFELYYLGSLDAAMTGHLQVTVQPRGATFNPGAQDRLSRGSSQQSPPAS